MENLKEGPGAFLSLGWEPQARPDPPLEQRLPKATQGAESGLGAGHAGKGGGRGVRLITAPGSGSATSHRGPAEDRATSSHPSHAHGDGTLHRVPAGRLPAVRGTRRGQLHALQEGVPGLHEHRAGRLHKEPEGPRGAGQDDEETGFE